MHNVVPKIDKNAKIAVLAGGMSSEAEVSKRSGKGCYDALQRLGYKNSELVIVDKDIANKLKGLTMLLTHCTANTAKTHVFREFWKS